MKKHILFIFCLVLGWAFSIHAESEPVWKLLPGGHYQIDLIVHEPDESWPARLVFTLTDTGKVSASRITYPGEVCRGEIKRLAVRRGEILIEEKIVSGRDMCDPGHYGFSLSQKLNQANRIKQAYFSLSGDRYRGQVIKWQYKPTVEARWRIAHQDDGWFDIRTSSDIKRWWTYLRATRGGSFYPSGLEILSTLLIEKGKTEGLIQFLKEFPDSPHAAKEKVLAALFDHGVKHHDWKALLAVAKTGGKQWKDRVFHTGQQWVEKAPDADDVLGLVQCCPSRSVGFVESWAETLSDKAWGLLTRLYQEAPSLRRSRKLQEKLYALAATGGNVSHLWWVVENMPEPYASDSLAQLLRRDDGVRAVIAHGDKLLVRKEMWARASDKFLSNQKGYSEVMPVLRALVKGGDTAPWRNLRQVFLDRLLKKPHLSVVRVAEPVNEEVAAYVRLMTAALGKSGQVEWRATGEGRTAEIRARIVAGSGAFEVRLPSEACSKEKEQEIVRTHTITAFLIIPVGMEKVKYRQTTWKCPVRLPEPLAQVFHDVGHVPAAVEYDQVVKVAVLERKPNAIGEAMAREARAPAKCKALRESCLARCEGLSDERNGLFLLSDSDKDKCKRHCYDAFYACSQQ